MESRRSLHWTIALLSFVLFTSNASRALEGGASWFNALLAIGFLAGAIWHGWAGEHEKNVKEYRPTITVGDYKHEAAS